MITYLIFSRIWMVYIYTQKEMGSNDDVLDFVVKNAPKNQALSIVAMIYAFLLDALILFILWYLIF